MNFTKPKKLLLLQLLPPNCFEEEKEKREKRKEKEKRRKKRSLSALGCLLPLSLVSLIY